jgi:glyoxylase-like metal-dependent hydrolase (beta-lactamase superfamily II)
VAFAQVAPGVLRMGSSLVNWHLVATDDGVTLVDCGAPAHRSQLERGLAQLRRGMEDVRAVILTHADADHCGFAGKLQQDRGTPVYVHPLEVEQARTAGRRPREGNIRRYLHHATAWKTIAHFARGGLPVKVPNPQAFHGDVLDVPGRPRVIHAPGHSPGCVAFHFADQDVLVVGDVLFNYNVLTGRVGPQVGPAAFNTSSEQALKSLDRLEGVSAGTILFGHGDPWSGGVDAAIAAARAAGKS